MPSGSNHPISDTLECPICGQEPQELKSDGGYIYFACSCGAANSGWTTTDAIGNWNVLVDARRARIVTALAKKLGIKLDELK